MLSFSPVNWLRWLYVSTYFKISYKDAVILPCELVKMIVCFYLL